MTFAEKCNHIFQVLDCTNSVIARSSEIDPSLISRFRRGKRKPRAKSTQFVLFCKGIIRYAEENNLLEKLQNECKLPFTGNPADEIAMYLIENNENIILNKKTYTTSMHFSEKLNTLMNIFHISNIRLAMALNVDSSLISRFRNGLRTPLKNNPIIECMCVYFYKIAKQTGIEQELSNLIGISVTKFEQKSDFIEDFKNWFSNESIQYNTHIMDSFLETLDNMSVVNIPKFPPIESIITEDILQETLNEYIGIDGMRHAVIRFLGTVTLTKKTLTLELYSDQNMNWLSNPEFYHKWATLMYLVLLKNTSVKIIHNINRNLDEMLIGIEKWLPLYMSGMVEGFYRRSHSDPWYSHTLFVAPGFAAISANIVTGTEDIGVYHYADGDEQTKYYENQMDNLMKKAKPLITVFKKNRINDYLFSTDELSKSQGSLKTMSTSLSFATIPTSLLENMLKRSGIEKEELASVISAHESFLKQFQRELKNGNITEYIVFPNKEELINSKVLLNLSDSFTDKIVCYTPEEYSEHIKHIIHLLAYEQYNIIPLNESPYSNVKIAVKEDVIAMVQKTDSPVTVFTFSHPLMCKAIDEYIDNSCNNNKLPISSKQELIKYLEKYITN